MGEIADLSAIDPTNPATWPTHCPTCNTELTRTRQCLGHAWDEDEDGERTGERRHCLAVARRGALHCGAHGGKAPQVQAAARRRLQAANLQGSIGAMLAELEADATEISPVQVLLDQVGRTHAMVQVLGALVGELEPKGSIATPASGDDARHLWGKNHLGDGVPHVLVEMYATWIDRATRASKLACDAGVEERLVTLAEEQAKLMAEVMRAYTVALGLDPADPAVREKMRGALTLVAGGG